MSEITGYTFKADIYCPTCVGTGIVEFVAEETNQRKFAEGWKGLNRWQVEELLDTIAGILGIDREDETTFDSDDFPKVIFSIQDDGLACGQCGEELG